MKHSHYPSPEKEPELYQLVSLHQDMIQTGNSVFFDDHELVDLASFYYSQNEMEDLQHILEYSDQLHPGIFDIILMKARFFVLKENFTEVRKYIEQAKIKYNELLKGNRMDEDELKKAEIDILLIEGEIALVDESPENAERLFMQAFNAASDKEEKSFVAVMIAFIYQCRNREEDSIQWIQQSLALDPDNQQALELLSYHYDHKNDIEEAEKVIEKLLDEDPYSTDYWKMSGDIQMNAENAEEAIDSYNFALAINPEDYTVLKNKALAFIKLENYTEALKLLEQYTNKFPEDYDAFAYTAVCLDALGKHLEAIQVLELFIDNEKIDSRELNFPINELYHLIVHSYLQAAKTERALEWMDKAIRKDIDKAIFTSIKGSIYLAAGEEKLGMEYINGVINNPLNDKERLVSVYAAASELFFGGFYTLSIELLHIIHKLNKNFECQYITSMLAFGYLELGMSEKYLQYLEEACKDTPEEVKRFFKLPDDVSIESFLLTEKIKYEL